MQSFDFPLSRRRGCLMLSLSLFISERDVNNFKDWTQTRHLVILTLTKYIDNRYGRINESEDKVLLLYPKIKASEEGWWWDVPLDAHHVLLRHSVQPEMWLMEVQSHRKHGSTTTLALFVLLSHLSPLWWVCTIIYPKKIIFLWCIVLQLFCIHNVCCM